MLAGSTLHFHTRFDLRPKSTNAIVSDVFNCVRAWVQRRFPATRFFRCRVCRAPITSEPARKFVGPLHSRASVARLVAQGLVGSDNDKVSRRL